MLGSFPPTAGGAAGIWAHFLLRGWLALWERRNLGCWAVGGTGPSPARTAFSAMGRSTLVLFTCVYFEV